MNDQPRCIDVFGHKAIFARLQQQANEAADPLDPCSILFSRPEIPGGVSGLELMNIWCQSIDDGWERSTTITPSGVVFSVEQDRVLRWRNASGAERGETPYRAKMNDLQLWVLHVNGKEVVEPFARRQHTEDLIKAVQEKRNSDLPVRYVNNIWPGSLKYLPLFLQRCPDVKVYNLLDIRHLVTGEEPGERPHMDLGALDHPASRFDTRSEVENEDDLPWVIQWLAHAGESTWFGSLPKVGKTWVLLCILLALLTGLPLFGDDRLTVAQKATRCIYLCPEAGRGSIKKRLTMLGLVEHLYDPITNPDGGLYLQTLSKKKIVLNDPMLLQLAKGADIFIDTAVRYVEGDENAVKDVKVVTENVLNLLTAGARSVWVAHHAAKGFENASSMTLQNMFRGSGEWGAALTNAFGLCTEEQATTKIRLHCICGRDFDELLPDMILQGRPYLFDIGNFKIVDGNAEPRKAGSPADPLKQQKLEFARNFRGTMQEKADALNEKFNSKHDKSTICKWLKPFDADKGVSDGTNQ